MKIKMLALGNILMEDDGVAVYLAEQLKDELLMMGIEVIRGETDIGYLLSNITEEDYLILLDATTLIPCGRIGCFSFGEENSDLMNCFQHDISLYSLCKIYYPTISGIVIGIGVAELEFHYGLSQQLSGMLNYLRKELLLIIRKEINTIESIKKLPRC